MRNAEKISQKHHFINKINHPSPVNFKHTHVTCMHHVLVLVTPQTHTTHTRYTSMIHDILITELKLLTKQDNESA